MVSADGVTPQEILDRRIHYRGMCHGCHVAESGVGQDLDLRQNLGQQAGHRQRRRRRESSPTINRTGIVSAVKARSGVDSLSSARLQHFTWTVAAAIASRPTSGVACQAPAPIRKSMKCSAAANLSPAASAAVARSTASRMPSASFGGVNAASTSEKRVGSYKTRARTRCGWRSAASSATAPAVGMADQRERRACARKHGFEQRHFVTQRHRAIGRPGRPVSGTQGVGREHVVTGRQALHQCSPLRRTAGVGVQANHAGADARFTAEGI